MNRVADIAAKVAGIPAWPAVTSRLVALIGREDHSIADLVRLVSMDVGLTAQVLRVANSATFARRGRCTGLNQAVLSLGEQVVVGIAIGVGTGDRLLAALSGYEAAPGDLWSHSLRTAFAAREFALRGRSHISGEEAFTAGLLHDIGKSVLDEYLKGSLKLLLTELDMAAGVDFLSVERRELGVDHAEVGAAVGARWNLPPRLLDVIRHHHSPAEAELSSRPLVYAVHLADMTAMALGDGAGADSLAYVLDKGYIEHISVTRSGYEAILTKVESEYTDALDLITVTGGA